MTESSVRPLFSKRDITKLLLPIVAEQFLAVAIGLADTIMVTFAGESAVSAISLVDSINILLIQLFASLATGGAVVAAQYWGAGDKTNAQASSRQLLQIVLMFSLFFTVLCAALHTAILALIFGKVNDDIMQGCETYFLLSYLSYPFIGLYNACAALFRSVKDTKTPLLISLIMNGINIGGNAVLIYGFGLGVAGAGIPSLISRAAGAVVAFVILQKKSNPLRIDRPGKVHFDFPLIKRILSIGIPNGIEGALFNIGKLLLSSLISGFGQIATTSNAIANTVASIANIPGSAIGIGLITIVGQCMGARQPDSAKKYTTSLLRLTYLCVFILDGLLFLFAPGIVGLFRLSAETGVMTIAILKPFAIANMILWPLAFELPNTLRASGDANFTMIVSMVSMWTFRIGLSYLLCTVFHMGVEAIWYAMYADWICRGACFLIRFLSGKWQSSRVI